MAAHVFPPSRSKRRAANPWLTVAAVAALVIAVPPSPAMAGPWTPEPGEGYAKVWLKWLPGFGYHGGDGETHDYGAYHELFVNAYAEIGVVDSLAAWIHAPLLQTFTLTDPSTDETDVHVSFGDPAAGLRWSFLSMGRFVFALDGGVRAPLANGDPVQIVRARAAPHDEIGALRVGNGAWDFSAGLGAGFGGDGYYLALGGGYIARTNDYDHDLYWTAEGGLRFLERWATRLRLTGRHPLGNGSAPRHESPSGIGNGTSYVGFALEGDYEVVDRWHLGVTFEGGLAAVRRQTGGPVISLYGATKF